jgi:hypothetical protein
VATVSIVFGIDALLGVSRTWRECRSRAALWEETVRPPETHRFDGHGRWHVSSGELAERPTQRPPRLTTSSTGEPPGSCTPASGKVETTRPRATLLETLEDEAAAAVRFLQLYRCLCESLAVEAGNETVVAAGEPRDGPHVADSAAEEDLLIGLQCQGCFVDRR